MKKTKRLIKRVKQPGGARCRRATGCGGDGGGLRGGATGEAERDEGDRERLRFEVAYGKTAAAAVTGPGIVRWWIGCPTQRARQRARASAMREMRANSLSRGEERDCCCEPGGCCRASSGFGQRQPKGVSGCQTPQVRQRRASHSGATSGE